MKKSLLILLLFSSIFLATACSSFASKELMQRAEAGDAEAQYWVGLGYYHGMGAKRSDVKACKWFQKAALQWHADAQYLLGEMYYYGLGVDEDREKAIEWYRKAANQGHADAQFELGYLYRIDLFNRYASESLKWYRKAALQGHVNAQETLGSFYCNGWVVDEDYEEAFKWFRRSALQGNSFAQNRLSDMYYRGQGTRKDDAEALKWMRKAALGGDWNAQLDFGKMYRDGNGFVAQSYSEALRWINKSAFAGNHNAHYELGKMYAKGLGVDVDYEEAYFWLELASAYGTRSCFDASFLGSIRLQQEIVHHLSEEQVNSIEQRAAQWQHELEKRDSKRVAQMLEKHRQKMAARWQAVLDGVAASP